MPDRERLPDEALVVRCGEPPFEKPHPLHERCQRHPEGVFGFSVQCAEGMDLAGLAIWCPNRVVGVTTVGAIRGLGYDVIRTEGVGYHATVEVPTGWDGDASRSLILLFRREVNPSGGRKP